jgi:predicted glycoside hydrolase/deacetylase ChbG (UPF0249 family)
MNVIINADDLGANSIVNKAIMRYAEKSFISSATILANGEDFNSIKEIVNNYPQISYGVHLNLTQFRSLLDSDILKEHGIVDHKGFFTGDIPTKLLTNNKEIKKEIYNEWVMQIEKILDNDISISHIDGHHFIHCLDELFSVLKKVQKKYKIKKVRINSRKPIAFYLKSKNNNNEFINQNNLLFREDNPSIYMVNNVDRVKKKIKNELWFYSLRYIYPTKTVDYFFSYLNFYNYLINGYKMSRKATVELMVHPGGSGCDWFKEENRLVENQTLQKLDSNCKIISYKDI